MRIKFVLAGAALVAASPLVAAQSATQTASAPGPLTAPLKAKSKGDPSRMVCRELDTTGSRVNRRRDCRTAQVWAEQNAIDRQALEQQQANRWKAE